MSNPLQTVIARANDSEAWSVLVAGDSPTYLTPIEARLFASVLVLNAEEVEKLNDVASTDSAEIFRLIRGEG